MYSRDVMLSIGDQFLPKRLLLRSMNLRVVRLAIEVEDMIPLTRLYDIANNVRDVKLFKYWGKIPSKWLEERCNSSSFFSEHNSVLYVPSLKRGSFILLPYSSRYLRTGRASKNFKTSLSKELSLKIKSVSLLSLVKRLGSIKKNWVFPPPNHIKLFSESKKMLTYLHFLANHGNYWKTNQEFEAPWKGATETHLAKHRHNHWQNSHIATNCWESSITWPLVALHLTPSQLQHSLFALLTHERRRLVFLILDFRNPLNSNKPILSSSIQHLFSRMRINSKAHRKNFTKGHSINKKSCTSK